MIRVLLAMLLYGATANAQGTIIQTPNEQADVAADRVRAVSGTGAEIRMLDKVSGDVIDQTIAVGDIATLGRIELKLSDCRYPEDNPTGEAYAWLDVHDPARDATLFQGWMIATSPALNALDHARYDIWVIRCTTA